MASSATGSNWGSSSLQMRPRSLRTVRRFTHVYLHAKTTVDAGDIRTSYEPRLF